jgi:hypothetical protein
MGFTVRKLNDRTALSVSSNARWDKGVSGHSYDSLSGCYVMLGNRTKLGIAMEAMSQVCSKCRKINLMKINCAQVTNCSLASY